MEPVETTETAERQRLSLRNRREEHPGFADSYGLVLVMLVITYFLSASIGDTNGGRMVTLVAVAATAWLALRASRVRPRILRIALGLIVLAAVLGIAFGIGAGDDLAKLTSITLNAALVIVAPVAIAKRLSGHHKVNADTFYGAVCIYLMLAMFFASAYAVLALVTGEPFFAQDIPNPSSTDYLYFSLTTITTTGYGDYTAAGNVGHLMAMTEAVCGQLYLITVVAMVVQNLGQERKGKDGV